MNKPYTFTKHDPDQYVHDKLFTVDRRDGGLNIHTGRISGSNVVTVTDEPLSNWDAVFASAATAVLSGVPGVPSAALHGAYVRSAMRGLGRGRDR